MTARQLIRAATERLLTVSSTPQLDAEVLLAHTLQISRSDLLLQTDRELEVAGFDVLIDRRLTGEPVAYIVGRKEFWGRNFIVSPDVLIPRPDSETLIATTLEAIDSLGHPARILEIGTGSGCLGLTILAERPTTTAKLTDVSPQALAIARRNADALAVADRAEFSEQDLLIGETGTYDILISNLPYVPEGWLAQSDEQPDTRGLPFEPHIALTGGTDGFDIFRRFFEQLADNPIAPLIILEHGDGQSDTLTDLLRQSLKSTNIESVLDLSGRPRIVVVRL